MTIKGKPHSLKAEYRSGCGKSSHAKRVSSKHWERYGFEKLSCRLSTHVQAKTRYLNDLINGGLSFGR